MSPDASLRRRRGWLWGMVVAAALLALVWSLFPLPDASARLQTVPRHGANFQGEDVTLSPMERAAFQRVNLIHRRYAFQGHTIFLTLIDGTRDRHVVHDPRFCFRGAGWEIVSEKSIPLGNGDARWLTTQQGEARAQAVFWFSDGGRAQASPLRYWWRTTLRRLTLGRSGAEPILCVLQVAGPGQPNLAQLAPEFVRALGL